MQARCTSSWFKYPDPTDAKPPPVRAGVKAGFRYGDMAPMAIIEFVDRDVDAKGAADRARVAAEEAADE